MKFQQKYQLVPIELQEKNYRNKIWLMDFQEYSKLHCQESLTMWVTLSHNYIIYND